MKYSGNIVRALTAGNTSVSASGSWQLEDATQQIGSGLWPAAVGLNDPNFYRTTLMLPGDGTNGGQNNTFLDSSANNFAITRNGNTTQGSFTPYGGANYSTFFGAGNYFVTSTSSLLATTFTIEMWVNFSTFTSSDANYSNLLGVNNTTTTTGNFLILGSYNGTAYAAGALTIFHQNSVKIALPGGTFAANQWYHIALVRSGTSLVLYINGSQAGSATIGAGDQYGASGVGYVIGSQNGFLGRTLNGFMSNLRITNNVALYTGAFTPSTAPLNTTANTTLLTCASERFEDLSASQYTFTLTGTPRVVEFSPFNSYNRTPVSYGAYFDGSGDYLTAPAGTQFQFTGDYTVEYWVYLTSVAGVQDFVGNYVSSASPDWTILLNGSKIQYYPSSAALFVESGVVAANTWYHVAAVRSGSTCSLYVNGVSVGTPLSFSGTLGDATRPIYISSRTGGSNYLNGAISNLRIVKGTALYTANFTPPTAPLTAVSGTSLLTCQDSTFKDNSANAFAITVNGSARPVKANPFNYTIALGTGYSPVTMGGSAYFDGTGDFLNFTGGTATSLNADFTIEGWLYANSFAVTQIILCIGDDFANPGVAFYVGTDGKLGIFYGNARALTGTTVAAANTWHHVAFVRSGSTITGYLNGVPQGTVTNSSTFSGTTTYIGGELYNGTAGGRNNGYVAGLRLVKGTALYTGPFVPPASPVTAVTNTQLLMNFANGSIFDYATGNTYETIGAAQINTTTKKYGTGSMSFNGTNSSLLAPYSPTLAFGGGDFTIECWFNLTAVPSVYAPIISFGAANSTTAGDSAFLLVINNSPRINGTFYVSSTPSQVLSPTTSVTTGTWTYLAVVRSGSTITCYLNGVASGTVSISGNINSATTYVARVGAVQLSGTTYYFNGFIDDLRVSNFARYTANFNPPTGPLPLY